MNHSDPLPPTKSDGSLENMFRLFRLEQPRGTVAKFHEWFEELIAMQKTVKSCPWCGGRPALRVGSDHKGIGLEYSVRCEGLSCPVNPSLNEWYSTPRKAIERWANEDN